MTVLAIRAAATLAFTFPAAAQTALFDLAGESVGDRFGTSVAGVGDVDGDSVPDWVVGAPLSDENGSMSGSVKVFSGTTGFEIYEFLGDSANDLFGHSVCGGDVNGDGRADIIVGAYGDDSNGVDSGTVYVYSGIDGSLLYSHHGTAAADNLGFSVAFVPDVDNDGLGEILVGGWLGDSLAINNGEALLIHGRSGAVLRTWHGENGFDFFGYDVAGLEDVNGDGAGDVVIGAPGNGANGSGAGSAYVYSGADGLLLYTLRGDAAGDGFGSVVSDGGDVNGDGLNEVFVGAPGSDLNLTNAGLARVYSGATGLVLYTFTGDNVGDNFGSSLAGNFDLTEDGISDLIVGAIAADPNGPSSGLVKIFSGSDGSVFATLEGDTSDGRFGAALAGGGDMNRDGYDELLVGAWGEEGGLGPYTGETYAITFMEMPDYTENFCKSLRNSSGVNALISSTGSTSVAFNQFVLVCNGAVSNTPGLFFYGQIELQVPFGDGFRCVGGTIYRTQPTTSDAFGAAQFAVDFTNPRVPEGEIMGGSTWKFQYWFRDTPANESGFNLSDGLSVDFIL